MQRRHAKTLFLASSAFVALCACHLPGDPGETVNHSKVLEVMVLAGAGNPERWTRQGLAMWFAQHEPVYRQVLALCAPEGQTDMSPVSNPERLACATVADQQAFRNVFGYAPPVASGRVW